jgi:hypothetical protein
MLPRYAYDANTIGGALSFWTAIANLVKERGRPVAGRANVDPNNSGHVESEQGSYRHFLAIHEELPFTACHALSGWICMASSSHDSSVQHVPNLCPQPVCCIPG